MYHHLVGFALADAANQEVRIFLGDPRLLANSRN
jgi:hypothetical protein